MGGSYCILIAIMLRHRNSSALPVPDSPFKHVVLDDRYAFLSALVAADIPDGAAAKGDIRAESEVVMRTVRNVLQSKVGRSQ